MKREGRFTLDVVSKELMKCKQGLITCVQYVCGKVPSNKVSSTCLINWVRAHAVCQKRCARRDVPGVEEAMDTIVQAKFLNT